MIHGYLLGKELGAGGMGRVFSATRSWDGLRVALKVLHPRLSRDPVARRSIATEALATTALEHDNVTTVLDLDEHPSHGMYLVSELVTGQSLRQLLDAKIELGRGLTILRDVLEGLRAAHAAGVVHGDLKPANVLVDDAGHVKVCDFGIAQVMAPTARGASRREAAGTPRYMAPEQFVPRITLDPRTDLYSFGVMLYEVLYGAAPFPAGVMDSLKAKAHPPAPPVIGVRGRPVPFALRALVASAIHPDIRHRPRFAAEVIECVASALVTEIRDGHDGPERAGGDGAGGQDGPASWSPRRRGISGARTAIEDAAEALGTVSDIDAARADPTTCDALAEADALDAAAAAPPSGLAAASGAGPASPFAPGAATGSAEAALSAVATEMLRTRLFHDVAAAKPAVTAPDASGPAAREMKTIVGTFESAFLSTSHTPGTGLVHMRPPPLVGRDAEQALLQREVQRVLATRSARVVVLSGPSGAGKSRLAGWLCSHVEASGAMEAASARFSSHAGPSACGLRGMVSALYAPSTTQVTRAVKASVAWIERVALPDALDEETLSLWLRTRSEADAADPHGTASLALGALAAYAEARPICLWFDDLTAAEDGSLELVARIAEEASGLPILVVATVSDEAMAEPGAASRLASIVERAALLPLGPLDLEARTRLLEGMLPLALGVAERAALRVGDNPLFIVQQVEQWVEARTFVHTDGGLVPAGNELDLALDTEALVDARVAAHLARTQEAVPVLFLLALLGPYGDGPALLAACEARGIDGSVVDLVLEEALCRGILRARADEVTFAHASLRAATLRRARDDGEYPQLAAHAADAIAATTAVERPSARAYVAVLLRDAKELGRAFDTLLEAIETMARGGDHAQADRLLLLVRRWAGEATAAEAERRRDEIDFADARSGYFQLDFERAQRIVDPLIGRLRQTVLHDGARVALLARALGLSGHASFFTDDLPRAEAAIAALRSEVEPARDPRSVIGCVIAHLESNIASLRGDEQSAFDAFYRSIDTDDPWMRWSIRGNLGEIEAARGHHDAARSFRQRARTECGALDVYQMRYLRVSDAKLALAHRERRERRVYEELVRSQGEAWSRTAARLALAAWDATFAPATMEPSTVAALDAFAHTPHDELLSHAFLRTVRDALAFTGRGELAARADFLLDSRRRVSQRTA